VSKPPLTKEQERQVFRAAGQQVAAAVLGRCCPPIAESLGPAAKIPVYGAFVSLKRKGQLRSCCGYLGQGVPLAEAIQHAAARAATDDPRFPPISAGELKNLDMDVWLLWGQQSVAARGADRAKAVEIGRHGVQIAQGGARGLLLPGVAVEFQLDAPAFLKQVCLKAGLPSDAWLDDDTELLTFEGYAIHGPLRRALVEKVRPAVHASPGYPHGGFYPDTAAKVRLVLDEFFAAAAQDQEPEAWPGIMVPHAGWVYSGQVAAKTYARVVVPSRAIVICPNHRGRGADLAVAPYDAWAAPGGTVAADPLLAEEMVAAIPGPELDEEAHQLEHAIEVQLPFLARQNPRVRVLGIAVGHCKLAELLRFGQRLAEFLRTLAERPLLVISGDMNHFQDDATTRRLDRLALEAMATCDPAQLFQTVEKHEISMCGVAAAVVVMETLRQLGLLRRCELVAYATSGDVTGDRARVVGYAGMLLG
jgi:AmmeMemoRadiSam system protein B/AmmeMemoRadiSam system protein A